MSRDKNAKQQRLLACYINNKRPLELILRRVLKICSKEFCFLNWEKENHIWDVVGLSLMVTLENTRDDKKYKE
jgi:hypothetical protein